MGSWWCGGNQSGTTACQSSDDARFVVYTAGSILGFPPITPSQSALTATPSELATTTFSAGPSSNATPVVASSSANTSPSPAVLIAAPASSLADTSSTDPAVSAHSDEPSTTLPTAIGVGIGVPLGIFAIGFLGFLFWKEVARRRKSEPQAKSAEVDESNGDWFGAAVIDGWSSELPDAQLPRELEGQGKTELPGM